MIDNELNTQEPVAPIGLKAENISDNEPNNEEKMNENYPDNLPSSSVDENIRQPVSPIINDPLPESVSKIEPEIEKITEVEIEDSGEELAKAKDLVVETDTVLNVDEEKFDEEFQDEDEELTEEPIHQHFAVKQEDYSKLSKEELVSTLKNFIENSPIEEYLSDVDIIKIVFYKKHKAHIETIKAQFIEDGGNIEDFKPIDDPQEAELKELINRYKNLKNDYNKRLELQKEDNLKEKYHIIEEIKELINGTESINRTFQEFRDLQRRWRDTGLVPQQNVKDLWETYHHHVEKFYDYIKINKELRDLDLKKNHDEKVKLCEKAEDLLIEPSIIKAFQELQSLHNQWREIGPVSREYKEDTWERFKSATSKINKKYQEHFEELKNTQKKNFEAKTLLCEKIEEIISTSLHSHKDWEEKSKEVKELQKVWKTIGFAPKKHNNKIYLQFRNGCDQFFAKMREFYAENKEAQSNNLQIKLDLCFQAETLKDSTDWKKTTEDLIQLQKKWKEVGPVPRKQSDDVWKRFRVACDMFFQHKHEHFANIDNEYLVNLEKKEALIKEIKEYELNDDGQVNIRILKEFQSRWAEIGFVPLKDKERIQAEYREALNMHFDHLNVDDNRKRILKFHNKVDTLKQNPKAVNRLKGEREKYIVKLKKLESNITLWENNIGFFAKSKNAQAMIEDVEQKIKQAKEEIILLEDKINMIDSLE